MGVQRRGDGAGTERGGGSGGDREGARAGGARVALVTSTRTWHGSAAR